MVVVFVTVTVSVTVMMVVVAVLIIAVVMVVMVMQIHRVSKHVHQIDYNHVRINRTAQHIIYPPVRVTAYINKHITCRYPRNVTYGRLETVQVHSAVRKK
jgi:hypothetical protein